MKRPLAILAVTLFLDLLGFGLIIPLIPVYITHYGGAPWVGGALLASFSAMQFLFSPIWGRVSDQRGRRPMILMSLIGSAISFVAFGFAPSLLILFVARVAAGILSAASLPTAQAYIADVTPPDKRASGMAVLGAAFGLGFALGPVIGGYASVPLRLGPLHTSSLETPALLAALLCFINFVWAFFQLPESLSEANRQPRKGSSVLDVFPAIATAMRNPAISYQLTVFAFTTFAFTAVETSFSWLVLLRFKERLADSVEQAWKASHGGQAFTTLALHARTDLIEHAQTAATSSVFAVVGVTAVCTQVLVIGGLARRLGENRMVRIGAAILTLSLLGIAFAPELWMLRVLAAGIASGSGLMNPALNALITQAADPKERGTLSGTQQGLGSLARIIAPPINNTVVTWKIASLPVGSVPFLSSALLMGVAFALSLKLKSLPRQEGTTPDNGANPLPQSGGAAATSDATVADTTAKGAKDKEAAIP